MGQRQYERVHAQLVSKFSERPSPVPAGEVRRVPFTGAGFYSVAMLGPSQGLGRSREPPPLRIEGG